MQKPMKFSNKEIVMSLLVIIISTLSACDNKPSEHLKKLTEDKYPVVKNVGLLHLNIASFKLTPVIDET